MVLRKKEKVKKTMICLFYFSKIISLDVQVALKFFAMDRTATQLEKDLIKTVKDQDVTRNLPSGKVKFVLPSYVKLK